MQEKADTLHAETARTIRPICLVQVERTGKDQREVGYIHAEDAQEYLLTLGVKEQQIAIKTSEKNDLKEPENLDLLSPTNQVCFIITKQGDLELVVDEDTTVSCALIFEGEWETGLSKVLEG